MLWSKGASASACSRPVSVRRHRAKLVVNWCRPNHWIAHFGVGLVARLRIPIEVNVSTSSSGHVPLAHKHSQLLLAELQEAHGKILEAMSELDKLTNGPLPTRACVIDARWAISRASLARRMLWSRVYAHLSCRASTEDETDLRRLQEADRALLRASSEHVSKWGIDAVMRDWAGYCEASNAIRWKMKAAIGAEKRLLYPMLGT